MNLILTIPRRVVPSEATRIQCPVPSQSAQFLQAASSRIASHAWPEWVTWPRRPRDRDAVFPVNRISGRLIDMLMAASTCNLDICRPTAATAITSTTVCVCNIDAAVTHLISIICLLSPCYRQMSRCRVSRWCVLHSSLFSFNFSHLLYTTYRFALRHLHTLHQLDKSGLRLYCCCPLQQITWQL